MAKKVIRLNENELHELIYESALSIINEAPEGYREGHVGPDDAYVSHKDPNEPGPIRKTFRRVINKTKYGMDKASDVNPKSSKYYGMVSKLLGGLTNHHSASEMNYGYGSRNRDDMNSYISRRGYKGTRKFNREDEKAFDDFMRDRGFSK